MHRQRPLKYPSCGHRAQDGCMEDVNGSLARAAIQQLHSVGIIKPVHQHSKCRLFTRATAETTEV